MTHERPPEGMADSLHELLPWYVAGTLATAEAAAFREHLDGCDACRDDMKFLKALRAELARHGEAFLAEHPSPDELFSFARGELAGDAAREVRRHLELCATCGAEVGWIRGDAVARAGQAGSEPGPAPRRARPSWLPWAAAVAAGVAGFLISPLLRAPDGGPRGETAPLEGTYLAGPQRDGAERATVEVRPGAARFLLVVDAGLDRDALPARFEILDAAGRTLREGRVGADAVYRGAFLFFDCERREFPDGSYLLRLTPPGAPALDYPFDVSSAAGATPPAR